jgi:hypothetical protein
VPTRGKGTSIDWTVAAVIATSRMDTTFIVSVCRAELGFVVMFAALCEAGFGPNLPSRVSLAMSANWGEAAVMARDLVVGNSKTTAPTRAPS